MGFTKTAPCPRCEFVLSKSATPTRVFRRIPENRRIRDLQSMVPEFVARIGGSKWVQAQPARRQQVAFGTADRQQVEPGTARSKGLRPSRALRGSRQSATPEESSIFSVSFSPHFTASPWVYSHRLIKRQRAGHRYAEAPSRRDGPEGVRLFRCLNTRSRGCRRGSCSRASARPQPTGARSRARRACPGCEPSS